MKRIPKFSEQELDNMVYIGYELDRNKNPKKIIDPDDLINYRISELNQLDNNVYGYHLNFSGDVNSYISLFMKYLSDFIDPESFYTNRTSTILFSHLIFRPEQLNEIKDFLNSKGLTPMMDYLLYTIACAQETFVEYHRDKQNAKGTKRTDTLNKEKNEAIRKEVAALIEALGITRSKDNESPKKNHKLTGIRFLYKSGDEGFLQNESLISDIQNVLLEHYLLSEPQYMKNELNYKFGLSELELDYDIHKELSARLYFLLTDFYSKEITKQGRKLGNGIKNPNSRVYKKLQKNYSFLFEYGDELIPSNFSQREMGRITSQILRFCLYPDINPKRKGHENTVLNWVKEFSAEDLPFPSKFVNISHDLFTNFYDQIFIRLMGTTVLNKNLREAKAICRIYELDGLNEEIAVIIQSLQAFTTIREMNVREEFASYVYEIDKPYNLPKAYSQNDISINKIIYYFNKDNKKYDISEPIPLSFCSDFLEKLFTSYPNLKPITLRKKYKHDVADSHLYFSYNTLKLTNPILIRFADSTFRYLKMRLEQLYTVKYTDKVYSVLVAHILKYGVREFYIDNRLTIKALTEIVVNSVDN